MASKVYPFYGNAFGLKYYGEEDERFVFESSGKLKLRV